MTTSKHSLITVLFNILNSNQGADEETLMMAVDAILVRHFVIWKEPTQKMKLRGDGSGTTRGYFKNIVFDKQGHWLKHRYIFSILVIHVMDFTLYELKKSNGNLESLEIY